MHGRTPPADLVALVRAYTPGRAVGAGRRAREGAGSCEVTLTKRVRPRPECPTPPSVPNIIRGVCRQQVVIPIMSWATVVANPTSDPLSSRTRRAAAREAPTSPIFTTSINLPPYTHPLVRPALAQHVVGCTRHTRRAGSGLGGRSARTIRPGSRGLLRGLPRS